MFQCENIQKDIERGPPNAFAPDSLLFLGRELNGSAGDAEKRKKDTMGSDAQDSLQLHQASSSPSDMSGGCWPETHRAFALGELVRKTRGSSWHGRVVGWYSTSLTPEGYAVESEREPGSVQIYPASALEKMPD